MKISTELIISPNLQKISKGEKTLIYDLKTGKSLLLNQGALTVLNLFKKSVSLEDIKNKYNAVGLDGLIEKLREKKLILHDNEQIPNPKTSFTEEKENGSLVKHLRLNVTERCNMDCSYCFERESNVYTKRRVMDWNIARKALNEFFSLVLDHKHEKVHIRFFGGEPLLNWGLIKQCLDYIKEKIPSNIKVDYLINTNGTLLSENIIRVLCEHGVRVGLSLDGVGEYHDKARRFRNGQGSFEVIDKNIDLLISHKCRFGFAVVCSDHNLPYMYKLIDYLKKKQDETQYQMNVNFSLVRRVNGEGLDSLAAEEKARYLINAVKYAKRNCIQCNGGLTHFVFEKLMNGSVGSFCAGIGGEVSIDPDGNIFSCSGLDIKIGTLDNFRDTFKSSEYKGLVLRRPGAISQCKGCSIEAFCAGGCLADVVWSSGQTNGNYPHCELQKIIFKRLVEENLLS
jgi:uncharacterized protein